MTTSTGQKVTVEEKSSTTYERGTTPTSAKAVAKGQNLLVLGTVNSTTITATPVSYTHLEGASMNGLLTASNTTGAK